MPLYLYLPACLSFNAGLGVPVTSHNPASFHHTLTHMHIHLHIHTHTPLHISSISPDHSVYLSSIRWWPHGHKLLRYTTRLPPSLSMHVGVVRAFCFAWKLSEWGVILCLPTALVVLPAILPACQGNRSLSTSKIHHIHLFPIELHCYFTRALILPSGE